MNRIERTSVRSTAWLLRCASFLISAALLCACNDDPPTLAERCVDVRERSRQDPDCDGGYEGCIALCRSTAVERCAAELDLLLECTGALANDALCNATDPRPCDAEQTALGVCVSEPGVAVDGGL